MGKAHRNKGDNIRKKMQLNIWFARGDGPWKYISNNIYNFTCVQNGHSNATICQKS